MDQLLIHIEQTQALIALIAHHAPVLPREYVITVRPEFFAERESHDDTLAQQSVRLSHYIEFQRARLAEFRVPLWTSSFPEFFDGLIRQGCLQFDPALSYCPPLDGEIEISRCLFCGGNAKLGSEVDRLVDVAINEPESFVGQGIEFALSLIPPAPNRSNAQLSIGVTMTMRVLFDRLYERRPFGPPEPGEAGLFDRLGKLAVASFRLPYHVNDPEKTIREYFMDEFRGGNPSRQLTSAAFYTNLVDILFAVHQCLDFTHEGVLMAALGKDELTNRERARILGFDDLFAYLIGVVLGADVPEFFSIGAFLARFTMKDSLSNALEYANAALSALTVHFQRLDAQDLEEQVNLNP
jgi:hypothetical protein